MGFIHRCRDNLSGEEAEVFSNWTGGLVSIPGDLEIHVLWPRKSAAMLRLADPQDAWQGMVAYDPRAGPQAWGDLEANQVLQVGGDFRVQQPTVYRLIDFILSWVDDLKQADFENVISYFCKMGVMADSWHILFDGLALWANRNSLMTVSEDGPIGEVTAEDRENFLANIEDFVRHLHIYGNTVIKLDPGVDWDLFIPPLPPCRPIADV